MKRAALWLLVAFLALVGVTCASWTPGVTIRLVDEGSAPAADAYVRYHYRAYRINPVHPVDYVVRGSVITTADAGGQIRIRGRLHFRSPLPLSGPARLFVDHAYVPFRWRGGD